MTGRASARRLAVSAVLLAAVFAAACLLCGVAYRLDNKYTAPGPQPRAGVLTLSDADAGAHPLLFLVRDWAIYRGRLLEPADFAGGSVPAPDEYTFIGQYAGLEGSLRSGGPARSPHGSATYRLVIDLPDETRSYTLETPEIFSAYRLYIDGREVAGMGDPDPAHYRAETGIASVTVQAAGRMEILFAVSDFSHFYSGMVYPPAFGTPAAVSGLLTLRVALRAMVCAVALCVGVLYLLTGLMSGRWGREEGRLSFLYGALCLCFAVYASHPAVRTLLPGGMGFYAVEGLSYSLMLLLVVLIGDHLFRRGGPTAALVCAFGVFMCVFALFAALLPGDSLRLMLAFSRLYGVYLVVCAAYVTFLAARAVWFGAAHFGFMLAGLVAFDASLLMDRLLPMFEPVRFGWFPELAGALLVALTGVVLSSEVAHELRLRHAMKARFESMSRLLNMQQTCYSVILEKEEEARAARHDLRHHLAVIRALAAEGDAAKLARFLDEYGVRERETASVSFCRHQVTDMLLRMYTALAERQETAFVVSASLDEPSPADDVELCAILSNILENALEASARIEPAQRCVQVRIGRSMGRLALLVDNRFDGAFRVEEGRVWSSKQSGREGVGLASVRASAARFGGSADFWADAEGWFHSEVLLPLAREGRAGDAGEDNGRNSV